MPPDFEPRLRTLAEVVVRIGLNLQPGQPLLITDPYDLQGIHPECAPLAATVERAAGTPTTVLTADRAALRCLLEDDDLDGYTALVRRHAERLQRHLAAGGAFLFLPGTAPELGAGLPPEWLARFDRAKWLLLGPLIQQLVRGTTQWTLVPAPTSDWARIAGSELEALWETVFAALRVGPALVARPQNSPPASGNPTASSLADWQLHLTALAWQRDQLNAAGHRRIRFVGAGTDLVARIPRTHRWCTAHLTTPRGVAFVANLPAEEIFTAPHKFAVRGRARISRPVAYGGVTIDGIELEFVRGRVVAASADAGAEVLEHLLSLDAGAARLGEIALVPRQEALPWAGRPHHHILLDENSTPHIALGDGYRFCSRAWWPLALNRSLLHLDLPLDAEVELE
jgi:aminopeptidase